MQLAYSQHKWHLTLILAPLNLNLALLSSILSTNKCNTRKSPFQKDINEIDKILTKYENKNGLNNFWNNLNLLLEVALMSFLQHKSISWKDIRVVKYRKLNAKMKKDILLLDKVSSLRSILSAL